MIYLWNFEHWNLTQLPTFRMHNLEKSKNSSKVFWIWGEILAFQTVLIIIHLSGVFHLQFRFIPVKQYKNKAFILVFCWLWSFISPKWLYVSFSVCPIFLASSVTGQNLDRLKKFLHVLPPSHNSVEQDKLTQELTEYQVHTRFYRDINVFHM